MQEPFSFQAPARLLDFMRQADQPGLINLAAGVPGLDALPFDALRESLDSVLKTDGAAIFAYHHPEGDHALRALCADRLKSRGVTGVEAGDIIMTTGCSQALQGMLSVLVRPGDVVACEAPAYYALLELIAQAGAKVLPVPVRDGSGIDLDVAEELLTRWRPRCFVVCTSLSNPSGATIPVASRERLVEVCRKTGVRLVEDDIYAELVDGGAPKPCRAFDDGSTVSFVTSFSKTVSPGLRVGYAVPGREFHEAFAARKCQQDLHSSVLSEVTLCGFMERGCFDPHLEWLRERNRRRRGLVLEAVRGTFPQGTKAEAPCGGYMVWAELPREIDMPVFREKAKAEGVVFAAGQVFFADRPPTSYFRLNCAKAAESDLVRGVEILGRLLG